MKFRWGIPSYQRAEDPFTLDLLTRLGYTKDEIIISTQTKEDYELYTKLQGDRATVIYREGTNDSINRNTLLDYFNEGEPILLLDDDIRSFNKLSPDGKKVTPIEDRATLELIFTRMFRFCAMNNSRMWAWYPIDNAFFMKHTVDDKNILVGTIFGIINSKDLRFDEEYDLKGDFEISLREITRGHNTFRFNGFSCTARHYSKGGCAEARANGNNKARFDDILKKYPTLVKPSHRDGEIKYIGKVTHIPEAKALKLIPTKHKED